MNKFEGKNMLHSKLSLAGLIAASMVLSACGGDTSSNLIIGSVPGASPDTSSRIAFDPGAGVLPLPSDLLFSGTTDGTLEPPDEVAAKTAGGAIDYGNPAISLGGVDGWSTLMPMQITLSMAEEATVDGTTLSGSTVIMIEAVTPPLDGSMGACQIPGVGVGLPCGVAGPPLTYGIDYVAVSGASTITIAPRKPLNDQTTYVVALAPGILDSRGEAIAASEFYEGVTRNDIDIAAPPLDSLQDAINLYEAIVAIGTGGNPAAAADMIFTAAWTTASVGEPIVTAATLLQASPPTVNSVVDTTLSVEQALIGAGALPSGALGTTSFASVSLYQGQITLPYYSGTPASGSDPLLDNWRALCDNPLAIQGAIAAGATLTPGPADAICNGASGGQLRDFGLDSARHLTKYNPIPAPRHNVDITVQITVPDGAAPAGGWPVVILQHGITSNKEAMLALTGALGQAGFATFAIDLPLHGSRGLASASSGEEANAGTDATAYMNLSQLLVARDNFSQSVFDIVGLRTAINTDITGALTAADFDTTQVHYVGMSLGGMVGVGATAIADELGIEFTRVVYSVPGGGIVPLLVESPSFGPLVQGSVLGASGTALGNEFVAFATTNAGCAGDIGCNFTEYTATLDAGSLGIIQTIMSQFSFAAQTIVDSIDPNNAAGAVVDSGVPVLVHEVVGDGVNNLPDQVIPNLTQAIPIGGTEPLVSFLGLSSVDTTSGPQASGIVRFIAGAHSSLLSPASSAATTTEMQTQVATFLAAGVVVATDPAVVAPAP